MKAAVTNAPTWRDAKRAEERTAILFTLVEEQQLPNAPKNTQKQKKNPTLFTWKSLISTQGRASRCPSSSFVLQLPLHLSPSASHRSRTSDPQSPHPTQPRPFKSRALINTRGPTNSRAGPISRT